MTSRTFIDMPARIARLPRDDRGFPVPFFVEWLDDDGKPARDGGGKPDFRIMSSRAYAQSVRGACWICGQPRGAFASFVVGPMCCINRVSAEPPSHADCALFAAKNCPFLSRPLAKRRTEGLPDDRVEPAGFMIDRNPGVTAVWTTRKWHLFKAYGGNQGTLIQLGPPDWVEYFCEGRRATRAEVQASVDSGLPILRDMAAKEGAAALRDLERQVQVAAQLLPAE